MRSASFIATGYNPPLEIRMRLTRERFTVRRMMVVATILIAVALLASARCRQGTVSECNYAKVETGMTVAQAEARLGPVVVGDRYFLWEEKAFGRRVWAGLTGD